jgi:hypothetical protein
MMAQPLRKCAILHQRPGVLECWPMISQAAQKHSVTGVSMPSLQGYIALPDDEHSLRL